MAMDLKEIEGLIKEALTDATIEIGVDEFNYEINYSDLQIDEEF